MARSPVFEIDLTAFFATPYPSFKEMRASAPIAFVPQLDGWAFTRRDDIYVCEKNVEIFSSEQPDGLMVKLMGQNMMRKDGESHGCERKAVFPTVSPKTVRDHWKGAFESIANQILTRLEKVKSAEICKDLAMPISGEALKLVTGLTNASYEQMDSWSQSMIDGISNYAGIDKVEERCKAATLAIDEAIAEMTPILRSNRDASLLSVMLAADLAPQSISANIKLAISGGQNEPRDVIAGCVWALLKHPEQLQDVLDGKVSWRQVFEEYCRWISPVGMTPRLITRDFIYNGIELKKGDKAFFMYSSANRDEDYFLNGDAFDVYRNEAGAVSFGAGPHFCAGAFVARSLVGEVALPMIFSRLKNLRLSDEEVEFAGWAFRGPIAVNVEWD